MTSLNDSNIESSHFGVFRYGAAKSPKMVTGEAIAQTGNIPTNVKISWHRVDPTKGTGYMARQLQTINPKIRAILRERTLSDF